MGEFWRHQKTPEELIKTHVVVQFPLVWQRQAKRKLVVLSLHKEIAPSEDVENEYVLLLESSAIMFQQHLPLIHCLQYASFIISQVTNGFLVFQILTKTQKIVGSYKYLMLALAMSSAAYGWIDVLVQPLMHVKGSIYVVFMTSDLRDSKVLGRVLVCIYCSSFALVISLLAAQFSYRYFVLCRQALLKHFDGWRLLLIFIPGVLCTFVWFQLAFWFACCTEEKQEILRYDLHYYYSENSSTLPFSAIMFYTRNSRTGDKNWQGSDLTAAAGCAIIVYGCLFIISFCAWKLYYTLKHSTSLLSLKTLEMNKQMFKTLVVQTILPLIMVFTPSGIVLTLPLLELYEGPLVNLVGVTVAFYPSLEPIVTILCVKDFRKCEFCRREDRVFEIRNSKVAAS